MSKRSALSRRNLLKALGLGPAVLPLLGSEQASGQVAPARRLFILSWANGMLSNVSDWATTGANFVLPPFMSSLEPYRDDLILLNGLNYNFIRDTAGSGERTGHACFQGMLTGALYSTLAAGTAANIAGGPSLDQYLGQELRAQQGYGGLLSLNLGVFVRSTARLSWRAAGAGNEIVPDQNPFNVFDNLFAGATATDAGPDPAAVRLSSIRGSILDYLKDDLPRFQTTVSLADQQRIEGHLASVRELELQLDRLASLAPGGFTPPTLPTDLGTATQNRFNSTEFFEATTQAMMDISVGAFASDATRVVVLQLGDQGDSNLVLTSLGFVDNGQTSGNTGLVQGYHVIAHDNGAAKVTVDTWFQSQYAYMVGQMKSTLDSSGAPLLDSSAVVSMNNMRTGNHETTAVPAAVAGSLGGYFQTGRSLAVNSPNNGLLVSLANGMGIETATFGDPMYGGELAALRG